MYFCELEDHVLVYDIISFKKLIYILTKLTPENMINLMIEIPEDIQKYLVQDEIIDNHLVLKEHDLFNITQVFISANRLLIKSGNDTKDIRFSHISSLKLYAKRHWFIVIIGIVFIVGTLYARQIDNPPYWATIGPWGRLMYDQGSFGGWFYYIIGGILIILGLLWTSPSIKFNVAGISEEQVLSGKKDKIDKLFKLVNERRFNQSNINPERSNLENN